MILNIETTTQVGSVSLAVEGNSWIIMEELESGDHAKNITLFIEEILKIADIKRWEIKAVAVSSGPGSYTGLRIGLSVSKGLCFALGVPLLGVPTLKALSYGLIENYKLNENDRIIALMDAKRMDAYAAVYDYKLNEVKAPFFLTLESDSFDVFIENDVFVKIAEHLVNKLPITTIADLSELNNQLELRNVSIDEEGITANVAYIDGFGNVHFNLHFNTFDKVRNGRDFKIYYARKNYFDKISKHYNEVKSGTELILFNSNNYLEIAINKGNASQLLGLKTNSKIIIEFL